MREGVISCLLEYLFKKPVCENQEQRLGPINTQAKSHDDGYKMWMIDKLGAVFFPSDSIGCKHHNFQIKLFNQTYLFDENVWLGSALKLKLEFIGALSIEDFLHGR